MTQVNVALPVIVCLLDEILRFVSSVRRAEEIAVKASLGLSAEEKLPDQLWWCDGKPWLGSDRDGERAHGERGCRPE